MKPHICHQIASRTLKLLYSMHDSENEQIRLVTNQSYQDNQSIIRRNINYICQTFDMKLSSVITSRVEIPVDITSDWKSKILNEIIDIKDEELGIEFEFVDLDYILNVLSIE